MPLGKNVGFNFDTGIPQGNTRNYQFDTSQPLDTQTVEFEIDIFHGIEAVGEFSGEVLSGDAYSGVESIFSIGFDQVRIDIPLNCYDGPSNTPVYQYALDDVYTAVASTCCDVELTTEPYFASKNIDFGLNNIVFGQTVKKQSFNIDLNDPVGGELNQESSEQKYIFDYGDVYDETINHNSLSHHNSNGSNVSFDLVFGCSINEDVTEPTYDVNLKSGNPTYDVDLNSFETSLTCGKRTNWNFDLCDVETSPELDADPHVFEYKADYEYICGLEEYNAYNGSSVTFSLSTVLEFYNIDANHGVYGSTDLSAEYALYANGYHGSYGDLELTDFPSLEIEMDGYHGSYTDTTLSATHVFQEVDGYHGSYGDLELEDYPAILIDGDAYHGSYGDADFTTTIIFDGDAYHGSDGSVDLEDNPSEGVGIVDAYHGSDGSVDFATVSIIDGDAYHGSYGDVDFTDNPAIEFTPTAYHGSYGDVDLNVTLLIFARAHAGALVDVQEFTVYPAQEIPSDAYHGATLVEFELDEYVDWYNTLADHGSYADATMNVSVALEPNAYFDIGAEFELDVQPASDAYHGVYSDLDLTTAEAEGITLNFYHGSYSESDSDIRRHEILVPHPIVASQRMYDGWGGVGGLNHCEHDNLSVYGDTAIRFPYSNTWALGFNHPEDDLDIEFADFGDRPWNTCSDNHIVFEADLLIRPRFEFEPMSYGSSTEMYMPKEFMALCEETPDEYVQRDNFGAIDIPEEPWYTNCCGRDFGHNTSTYWFFEPIEYMRFCPGYIRPNGNSVLFEFDGDIDYDCHLWYATGGENLSADLSVTHHYDVSNSFGAYARASLATEDVMLLQIWHGQHASIDVPTITVNEIDHGSVMYVSLYEPPMDGYSGEYAEIVELVVPGPAIQWNTEEGCLPNDFLPITESGDIDFVAIDKDVYKEDYPPLPVENRNYRYFLDATCIAFDYTGEE